MTSSIPSKTTIAAVSRQHERTRSVGIELIGAILLAACGHLLIKRGLASVPAMPHAAIAERILTYLLTPQVIAGLAVYGIGTVLWIAVASKRDISFLYPITAVNYVLITLGGMWMFGEQVSMQRWSGIVLVMAGVALLQFMNRENER